MNIGMVLQETVLFSGTIKDNLLFGVDEVMPDGELEEVAKAAQAWDFISETKHGFDTKLGQRGVNLSGGQKQRIAIGRGAGKKAAHFDFRRFHKRGGVYRPKPRYTEAMNKMLEGTTVIMVGTTGKHRFKCRQNHCARRRGNRGRGAHIRNYLRETRVYRDIYKSQLGEDE